MVPPAGAPPGRTLFPYTTLFRSPSITISGQVMRRKGRGLEWEPLLKNNLSHRTLPITPAALAVLRRRAEHRQRDRKSTRLNSSHVASSYAVFCLKKKNMTAGTLV